MKKDRKKYRKEEKKRGRKWGKNERERLKTEERMGKGER